LSTTYWEGAVQITGQQAQQMLEGRGYVELTGYERKVQL
jgi:predicted secreted hydrolase